MKIVKGKLELTNEEYAFFLFLVSMGVMIFLSSLLAISTFIALLLFMAVVLFPRS